MKADKKNMKSGMSYYQEGRKYNPIDVIEDWGLNFNLGNAVKYVSRAGRKEERDARIDMYKAISYIAHELGDFDVWDLAVKKIDGLNERQKDAEEDAKEDMKRREVVWSTYMAWREKNGKGGV